jgi:predicted ATPase
MKLRALNLANFRGFEQIELSFEPDVTLIAGANGVGKSAVLKVLATLFSKALPDFTPSTARPLSFSDDDIFSGKPLFEASMKVSVDEDQLCLAGVQRVRDSDEGDQFNCFWLKETTTATASMSFSEALSARRLTGDLDAPRSDTERMLHELKERRIQPIVVYFSPRRQLPSTPKTLQRLEPFEIANAYRSALQEREVELREFMHWFRVVETGTSQSYLHGKDILDKLNSVVTSYIPEFRELRVEESPALRFLVTKNDLPLSLTQLSDGERGLLAMLFDLTRRLSIANPGLEDPIGKGSALVLIDEIELHLHPIWQRQVIRKFQEIFKSCQFVVTTHSPMALGEVEARSVRFLERDERLKVICTVPDAAYGLDANRVLRELMGAPVRTKEVTARLKQLFDMIEAEKFDGPGGAREIIDQLRRRLGEDDPELTRASSLIKFLEGEP